MCYSTIWFLSFPLLDKLVTLWKVSQHLSLINWFYPISDFYILSLFQSSSSLKSLHKIPYSLLSSFPNCIIDIITSQYHWWRLDTQSHILTTIHASTMLLDVPVPCIWVQHTHKAMNPKWHRLHHYNITASNWHIWPQFWQQRLVLLLVHNTICKCESQNNDSIAVPICVLMPNTCMAGGRWKTLNQQSIWNWAEDGWDCFWHLVILIIVWLLQLIISELIKLIGTM